MSRTVLCVSLAFFLLCLFPGDALGEERNRMGIEETIQKEEADDKEEENGLTLSELDFSSVEEILETTGQGTESFSFGELLEMIFRGDVKGACAMAFHSLLDSLFSELSAGSGRMAQIFLIALTGAVFTCFSDIFSGGQISETAFYVTFLLLFSLLASSFYESFDTWIFYDCSVYRRKSQRRSRMQLDAFFDYSGSVASFKAYFPGV